MVSLEILDLRQKVRPPADFQVLKITPILAQSTEKIRNAGFEVELPCQYPVRFPYVRGIH